MLQLRKQLLKDGHDAGAETIVWHLVQQHAIRLSRATIHRILTRHGAPASTWPARSSPWNLGRGRGPIAHTIIEGAPA